MGLDELSVNHEVIDHQNHRDKSSQNIFAAQRATPLNI